MPQQRATASDSRVQIGRTKGEPGVERHLMS